MSVVLIKEGIFTSLQGLGTMGLQRFGVSPRGAMDSTAARVANILAGNVRDAAVLEFYFPAPEIEFHTECRIALAGADFDAHLDGAPVRLVRSYLVGPGSILRFSNKLGGNICNLAVSGGFKSPDLTGAHQAGATSTIRFGRGTRLDFEGASQARFSSLGGLAVSTAILPKYCVSPTVRFIPGAEYYRLSEGAKQTLVNTEFAVSNDSNRMGFRLIGEELETIHSEELVSAVVTFGTMQLLPDGQLIILMADHQVSGGYPRIAHILSTDLPLVSQLAPNDRITFKPSTLEEAEADVESLDRALTILLIGVEARSRV